MIPKIVIGLLLTIIISGFGLSQVGDGIFSFLPQSDAQQIIEEANSVEEALDLYSLENGGVVDIGDPLLCEPDVNGVTATVASGACTVGQRTLHYVREAKLLKNYVGREFDTDVDPWRMDEGTATIERVVASEESCKEINNIRLGTPMNEDVPSCGTPEGDAVFCCVSN